MKVLIAEDSTVMRRLLRSCLQAWRYEVVEAEDGAQAWKLFQEGKFSLILTDWLMPEMDGLDLTRRIRSHDVYGYVYIILLTAKAEKADLVEAMEAGADDFLVKPFDRDELRVRMRAGERIVELERTLAEQNRQLREAQTALVHSEKLASLGQLAAGMAHEINNPVAYVTNNLAVLKRDVRAVLELVRAYQNEMQPLAESAPESAAAVNELEEECDLPWIQENLPRLIEASVSGLARVRDVVKNLRDFARLDEAELDTLDLNEALRCTVEVLGREMEAKQIQMEQSLEELPPVVCRPGKINQMFHSLLLNAIQASREGGIIQLRSAFVGDRAVVEAQDHGCGIEPSHLSRIFEPFFTTKPVGRGTGLGLAVCYGIVSNHGGTIDVESQVGEGSTFRVSLPIRPPQASDAGQG